MSTQDTTPQESPPSGPDRAGDTRRLALAVALCFVLGGFVLHGIGRGLGRGSAGFSRLAIAGHVRSIGQPPRSPLNSLLYGSPLRDVQELELDIVRSEVPPDDIAHLFAADRLLAEVKPGALYCFHVSHVGSYFTFPFRSRHGFAVYAVHEVSEQEFPHIAPRPGWARPYRLYSLAAILLQLAAITVLLLLVERICRIGRTGRIGRTRKRAR